MHTSRAGSNFIWKTVLQHRWLTLSSPIATICTSGFYISTNGRAIEVVEHLENDPLGYFSISNAINDNSLMPGPQIQCCVGGWSNVVWAGRGERKMFLSCSKIEFYSQASQHLANCRLNFESFTSSGLSLLLPSQVRPFSTLDEILRLSSF